MATQEPPSDPWSGWTSSATTGSPQPVAEDSPGTARLPDSAQDQGEQATGETPARESDSQEWPGSGWTQHQWQERSRDWDDSQWGRRTSWSQQDWRTDHYYDNSSWSRGQCGDWNGTSDSTRDSDRGSDGPWQGRRCSSNEDYWTSSTWTRRDQDANHAEEDYHNKKATLSERMAVPSFSADSTGDDLGASARSYLRQIDAWIKVTRAPRHQQALLLYQHLQGRAWVESEELSVDVLASESGVQVFRQWVQDRYQEVEVSKVAEALTYFFRKLKRGQHQSIREYNSLYDRAHTRLLEIDCKLPEVARAWAYLNGLGLSHSEELGVLASVNNDYNTSRLQRAAILHEKSLKGPWAYLRNGAGDSRRPGFNKGPKGAYVTEHNEDSDHETSTFVGDDLPEEEAAELHEAYMAQESAKAKFREIAKARGLNPESAKSEGKTSAEKLQIAKSRSFCSGCKRRGHWHRDAECPLNQGKGGPDRGDAKDHGSSAKETYVVQIAYEVGDDATSDNLYAITDCACSKTVAGQRWIQNYLTKAKKVGWEPQLIPCDDEFKFGASKLFKANYTATVVIQVGKKSFMVRAAVVSGDVPLLLSRNTLAKLGMVYDLENHCADFKKLDIYNHKLCFTSSGHPSLPVSPSKGASPQYPDPQEWGAREVIVNSVPAPVYTAFVTGLGEDEVVQQAPEPHRVLPATLFFPKKVESVVYNMLTAQTFDPVVFISWWSTTKHCNDFWIEGPSDWIRVHIIPRKNLFSPEQWRTSNIEHKEALLEHLGCVRSTWAAACQDSRRLAPVHDMWRGKLSSPLAALWVGKTMFAKAAPTSHPDRAAHVTSCASEEHMAHDEGGPDQVRDRHRSDASFQLDGAGNPGGDPREKVESEPISDTERAREHDLGGATGQSERAPGDDQRQHGQGGDHQAHPRLHTGPGRGSGFVRPVQELHVQGCTRKLLDVGDQGNESQCRSERRPEEVGELGGNARGLQEQGRRPGGECGDTLPAGDGRALGDRIGGKLVNGGSATSTPYEGIREGEGHRPSEWDQEAPGRPDQPDAHAAGRPAGSGTGAQRPHGPHGSPARPVQSSADSNTAVKNFEHLQSDVFYESTAYSEPGSENGVTCGQQPGHFGTVLEDSVKSFSTSGRPLDEEVGAVQNDNIYNDAYNEDAYLECYETRLGDINELEKLAKEKRINKQFNPSDCQQIVDGACTVGGATPRRSCQSRGKTVILGGYVHGGVTGVTTRSYLFNEVTKYVNAYLKHHHPGKARWTSLSLNKGNMAGPHRDSHNHADSYNLTTSFGQKSGGRLWIEDGEQDQLTGKKHVMTLDNNKEINGIFVDTKDRVITFHPRRRHFVEAWTGERLSITAYSIRSIDRLTREQRDLLRSKGFPITPLVPETPQEAHCAEHKVVLSPGVEEISCRPKKSIRRSLRKSAALAGGLLAMTMATASSFLCEMYPRPDSGVALQEVGGYQQTYLATELGYDVVEPFETNCWNDKDSYNKLHENLKTFSPRVLWIHDDGNLCQGGELLREVQITAEIQLSNGGTVVCQAHERAPLWQSPRVLRLQEHYVHRTEYKGEVCYLWLRELPLREDTPLTTTEEVYMNNNREQDREAPIGAEAISFDKVVAPHVKSALTRLHQNLGHPANADLTRHLRLAGADDDIIKIAKGMRCQVCDRNKRTAAPRPASLPTFLDFNQLVSVDVFHVFDVNRKRHEMLSVIDHGTTFHLVKRLPGHSAPSFEKAFVDLWSNTFGSPACIAADLETGLQAGLARYCEFAGVKLRASAGQAHWQQGTIERHGQWHQDILQKIIDEQSVGEDDIDQAVAVANQAKNELRRRHGYSPCQAVFGKDPRYPEDLLNGNDEEHVLELMTGDRKRQKEVAMRTAARIAFYRSQVDVKLRKGLIQRARVKKGSYAIGEMVCFYRLGKSGTTSKRGQWKGPGLILGNDGGNWWISYGGRCHLVAEEHMRPSTAEELGSLFSSRVTRQDLETLLFADPDDPGNYTTPEHPREPEPGDQEMEDLDVELDIEEPRFEHDLPNEDTEMPGPPTGPSSSYGPEGRRRRKKSKPPGTEPYEAHMMKIATTERSREKQYEKELPWRHIPPEQHAAFKEAERKQIKEHLDHEALRMLTLEETTEVLRTVPPERVLTSRWAYKDKNYAKRRGNKDIAWRPKARLIIGGHKDPDIPLLVTDAPTVSRLSVLVLMQILACHLEDPDPWIACAGDVNAAFLNGQPLQRTLFMKQPRSGIQGMTPGAIFQVTKGIFGLPDSPRGWWEEVQRLVDTVRVPSHDGYLRLTACALDPCVYYLVPENDRDGCPQAYLCIHVDDLLVVGPRSLAVKLREVLSQVLPIEEWEENNFDYIGSHFEIRADCVEVTQTSYAATRLFTIEFDKTQLDQEGATKDQAVDNQSLIGGLSWLAVQSRPDLQVSVSIAQQMQKAPSVEDLKFTNAASRKAYNFKEEGLKFTKIDLNDPMLMVFHDSSWANVVPLEGEDGFRLSQEDHEKGYINEVPSDYQVRKAKRASTRVASQYGILVLVTDTDKMMNGSRCNILDWKSSTAKRVCRSTFAAESIACCEGLEQGQYVRSVFMTLLRGPLQKVEQLEGRHLKCLTDCRSLYDHLHRVGVPRTPTDKRLAIDLAAIRQILHRERNQGQLPLQWIPTEYQLADVLTKPMCPKKWWNQINGTYKIPFRSSLKDEGSFQAV